MSWNTDLSPLEYLIKRQKYYLRHAKKYRKFIEEPELMERLQITERGREMYTIENIRRAYEHCMLRYNQFYEAIAVLSQNT